VPYQSFFAGSTKAAPAKSSGGYQSFYGSATIAQPSAQQLQQQRQKKAQDDQVVQKKQQQEQQQKQAKQQATKPQSLFSKVKTFATPLKDAAVGSAGSVYNIASIVPKETQIVKAKYGTPHDQKAQAQAAQNKKEIGKNIEEAKSFARFAPRAAAQVAESVPLPVINPHPSEKNVQVTAKAPKLLKTVLGSEPIPSLQNTYKTVKQQAGTPAAAGTVTATAIGDALALKGGHDAVAKTAGKAKVVAGKDAEVTALVKNSKTQSLLDKSRPKTPMATAVDTMTPETTKSLDSIMSKVRTPKRVLDQAKAQQLATKTASETAEKNKVAADKVDQKIELLNAKKADGKFSNVDKVKVQQLKDEKQKLGVEPNAVSAPSTTPLLPRSGGAETVPTSKPPVATAKSLPSESLPNSTPDKAIKQALDATYKPSKKPSTHETTAITYLRKNPQKALTDYDSRVKEKFGATNVVSGDEAKYVIPGFDSTKSVGYHEPASALAKVKYQQLLADTTTKDKPVLLMSGGSGAGKTSALKRLGINYDNYAAVIDTNTNKLSGAESRIKQAVDAGHEVQVFYVHRDPVKAFTEGVIPRGTKEGRIVPIDTHLDTHYGSHEVVKQLADKYGDHPLVDISAASNNHGHGKARPLELDNIPKMRYSKDELRTILKKEVDNAHQKGQISPEEHALYHGDSSTVAKTADRQPEPQRTTGPEGKPEAKVAATSGSAANSETRAVQAGLVKEFQDKAQYSSGSFKQEAANAVELVKTDPEKARSIALGQEPGNNTIHEVAVAKALENKALKEHDTETLLALASSPRHTITSEAAQRLGAEGYESGDSVVKNIAALRKVRQDALEKKTGKSATKAVSNEIKLIKAAKPKATKETWASFVESIAC
jgi:hypothetical protein